MGSLTSLLSVSYRTRLYTTELHLKAARRVIDLLRSDPNRTFTIREMAHTAYMSPFHFIRVFQDITGAAPCKFQWALKIHNAKALLIESNMPILEICMEVGYNSLGTFTRRFSELVGLSPSRFRRFARTAAAAQFEKATAKCPVFTSSVNFPVTGRVDAPRQFEGSIVVAAFHGPLAQARPAHYTVAGPDGSFTIRERDQQNLHLWAFGIPYGASISPWLTDDALLRGRAIWDPVTGKCDMFLRAAVPTDPPILIALAALFQGHLLESRGAFEDLNDTPELVAQSVSGYRTSLVG